MSKWGCPCSRSYTSLELRKGSEPETQMWAPSGRGCDLKPWRGAAGCPCVLASRWCALQQKQCEGILLDHGAAMGVRIFSILKESDGQGWVSGPHPYGTDIIPTKRVDPDLFQVPPRQSCTSAKIVDTWPLSTKGWAGCTLLACFFLKPAREAGGSA